MNDIKQRIDSLDNFKPMPNTFLVKFKEHTKKTVGGVLTEGIKLSAEYQAKFTNRIAEVIVLPTKLVCSEKIGNSMAYECDIDIEVGDTVYFEPSESVHAQKIIVGEDEYAIVNYSAVILSLRGEEVIMCNGFVLFDKVYRDDIKDLQGNALINREIEDKRFGVVRYLGKPNKSYRLQERNSTIKRTDNIGELKVGQKVLFLMPQFSWDLEEWAFAVFDDRNVLNVGKRYMIGGICEE